MADIFEFDEDVLASDVSKLSLGRPGEVALESSERDNVGDLYRYPASKPISISKTQHRRTGSTGSLLVGSAGSLTNRLRESLLRLILRSHLCLVMLRSPPWLKTLSCVAR